MSHSSTTRRVITGNSSNNNNNYHKKTLTLNRAPLVPNVRDLNIINGSGGCGLLESMGLRFNDTIFNRLTGPPISREQLSKLVPDLYSRLVKREKYETNMKKREENNAKAILVKQLLAFAEEKRVSPKNVKREAVKIRLHSNVLNSINK
jgi:hypothetical protein